MALVLTISCISHFIHHFLNLPNNIILKKFPRILYPNYSPQINWKIKAQQFHFSAEQKDPSKILVVIVSSLSNRAPISYLPLGVHTGVNANSFSASFSASIWSVFGAPTPPHPPDVTSTHISELTQSHGIPTNCWELFCSVLPSTSRKM